jgi:hypothetical protein
LSIYPGGFITDTGVSVKEIYTITKSTLILW